MEYKEGRDRTKKRRVNELVANTSAEQIQCAADIVNSQSNKTNKQWLNYQSLALFYDLGLTVRKYNRLRSVVNGILKHFFPSYYELVKLKDAIFPRPVIVTETSAEVPLQQLLDKTAERLQCVKQICKNVEVVLQDIAKGVLMKILIIACTEKDSKKLIKPTNVLFYCFISLENFEGG